MRYMEWHPQSFVTDPPNHAVVQVFRDYWWLVNDKDEVAIYHRTSPQCNPNKAIVERILPRTEGAVGIVQIPVAFVSWTVEG